MGNRQAYEDPTAAEAIGNVMKQAQGKPFARTPGGCEQNVNIE